MIFIQLCVYVCESPKKKKFFLCYNEKLKNEKNLILLYLTQITMKKNGQKSQLCICILNKTHHAKHPNNHPYPVLTYVILYSTI